VPSLPAHNAAKPREATELGANLGNLRMFS
jgi:hypothetical protein